MRSPFPVIDAAALAAAQSLAAGQSGADYRDSRVRKIVLLDPAQGSALRQGSLSAIALPSLIVGATNNDFLPWRSHGERYAAIPNAQIVLLKGQEGHFVFLTPCQHQTRVMGVPLCEDRPGVDRAAVHRDLTARIIEFVKLDNEPAPAPPQSTATSSSPDFSCAARSDGIVRVSNSRDTDGATD